VHHARPNPLPRLGYTHVRRSTTQVNNPPRPAHKQTIFEWYIPDMLILTLNIVVVRDAARVAYLVRRPIGTEGGCTKNKKPHHV